MKIINLWLLFVFVCGTAIATDDMDTTPPIFPQQLTAHKLLTYCLSSSLTDTGRQRQRYCWGFIGGVEEAIRVTQHASGQSLELKACPPDGVSSRVMAKAYIDYAGRRGSDLSRPAAQIAIEALSSSYPCPN